MTIRHLKIFLAVYERNSITRAAEQLHMTQPAVTRAIREIEKYYGICLFERMNRHLAATETGKEFYSQALHIVEAFDTLEKTMHNWDSAGILRVGASITLGNFVLPGLAGAFEQSRPGVRIQAVISNGSQLEKGLMENRLDLAMMEGSTHEPELHAEPFRRDHLVLLLPPGHPLGQKNPVSLEELCACPLLLREKGSAGRSLVDHVFAAQGLEVRPKWESASTQALVKAVAAGIGISILPFQLVQADLEAGRVETAQLSEKAFWRQNYLVWHKNKYLTPAMKAFVQLCRENSARPEE